MSRILRWSLPYLVVATLLAIGPFSPPEAKADESLGTGFQGAVSAGIFSPAANSSVDQFGVGPNFGLEFGGWMCPHFGVFGGADFYFRTLDGVNILLVPCRVTAMYRNALTDKAVVRVGVGFTGEVAAWSTTQSGGSSSNSEGAFGGHVVTGIDFKLTNLLSLGPEFKYTYVKKNSDDFSGFTAGLAFRF